LTINLNPIAADFNISGTRTFIYDGSPKTITIMPNEGKSSGTITIKYNDSTIAPSVVGTYTVTFDVADATGFNAVSGLSAGNMTIEKATPIDDDFNISGIGTFDWDGSPKTVTIIPKEGKSDGSITVRYNGSTIVPSAGSIYTVTFDVASGTNFNYASGFNAGILTINPPTFNSITELRTYLQGNPANIANNPYYINLNISDLGGGSDTSGSVGNVLRTNSTKYVYLDLSDSTFTSLGDYAFSTCTNLTSVTIPNSITRIAQYAFMDCTGLTSITIPDSVTIIDRSAFYNCTSLISVTIPNSVTAIGYSSFYNCTNLISVTIPDSVTSIVQNAFQYWHWG